MSYQNYTLINHLPELTLLLILDKNTFFSGGGKGVNKRIVLILLRAKYYCPKFIDYCQDGRLLQEIKICERFANSYNVLLSGLDW